MDRSTVLTKTAKGLMEVTGKTSILPHDPRNVLAQVDGKATVGDLHQRLDTITEATLIDTLGKLVKDGFVREFVSAPPIDAPLPRESDPHQTEKAGTVGDLVAALISNEKERLQPVRLQVKDDWTGSSALAPVVRHHEFALVDGSYDGKSYFRVGSGPFSPERIPRFETTVPATLPIAVLHAFLSQVFETPIWRGPYVPNRDDLCDYPDQRIEIEFSASTLRISSQSQGEEAVPWRVEIDNVTWVVHTGSPARCLALLYPHLNGPAFGRLYESAARAGQAG